MSDQQRVDEQQDACEQKSALRRFLPLAILVAITVLAVSQGWHKYLSFEQLATHNDLLKAFVAGNLIVALAAFMALYVVIVALSLPGGSLLTLTGGVLFGWITTGFAVVFAATIGATIVFLIARSSLGENLAAKAGPWLEKFAKEFNKEAFHGLLFLRLCPAFPFWFVNLAPALLGMKLRTYLIATFIGIIPGTFAFAFLGTGLESIIEAQQQANLGCMGEDCSFEFSVNALVTPEILIALFALAFVALLPIVLKRWRNQPACD